MTQWLRACAAPADDPSSVPSTHIGWFTTACDSQSRGPDGLSWFSGHLYSAFTSHLPPPNIHKDKISLKQTNMCLGKTSRRKHSFHNANCEDMEGLPRFSDWENSIVAISSKVSYTPDTIRIEIRTLFFTGKATSKLTSKHGKPWVVKNKSAEQKK